VNLTVPCEGGFVSGIDHSVPADVSWDHNRWYLELLAEAAKL